MTEFDETIGDFPVPLKTKLTCSYLVRVVFKVLTNRSLRGLLLFNFAINLCPTTDAIMFSYLLNELKFTTENIAILGSITSVSCMIAICTMSYIGTVCFSLTLIR